jgi:hypothetical protein
MTEMKKMKILNFPKYDDKTDSFVDSDLPASADAFFEDSDRMKEFFQIKKYPKADHTKDEQPHNH